MTTFVEKYRAIVLAALQTGVEELNARTGKKIKALPTGASFTVNLARGLPTIGLRKTWPHHSAAEAAWCLMGHDHCDWLRKHTKVWDQFCDVRDCANCEGTGRRQDFSTSMDNFYACQNCNATGKTYWLDQAYGARWHDFNGVNQLQEALRRLKRDPSDRRVYISSWDPEFDIVEDNQKTVPCPVGFTLSILDGLLNSTLMIRSSDLYFGLPYDVMRHSFVVAAVAAELGVRPGVARFALAHPHLYEPQWEVAYDMAMQIPVAPRLNFPALGVRQIIERPDDYVEMVKMAQDALAWPSFNPKSEVAK